nr:unnamed protein product [Digitaria exilis]
MEATPISVKPPSPSPAAPPPATLEPRDLPTHAAVATEVEPCSMNQLAVAVTPDPKRSSRQKVEEAADGNGCKHCASIAHVLLEVVIVLRSVGANHVSTKMHMQKQFRLHARKMLIILPLQLHQGEVATARNQDGTGCSLFCRCDDCQNPFGKNEGIMAEDSKRYLYTGADLDHSEGEHDFVVERSPRLQSPISKESSFHHQTPPHLRASSRDGHLFPHALSQWQALPRSWHCSNKRNSNDRVMDDSANYKNSNNDWQLSKHEDSYSISKCVQILNGMVELSQVEKSVGPDVFLLPGNREIFISLGGDVRAMWLKRKIQHLT